MSEVYKYVFHLRMRFPGQPMEDLAALGQRVLPVVKLTFQVRDLFKQQTLLGLFPSSNKCHRMILGKIK